MKEFLAINESTLIEDTEVDCDLYLESHVNGVPRYILFSHSGELFHGDRRKQLIENNITKLYVYANSYKTFNDYQEQNLKTILADSEKSSIEKSNIVYSVAKNLTQELLNNTKSGVKIDRVTSWADNTVDYILRDEKAFSNLIKVTSYDYKTYTHSVNVSVLGLLFGKHLGFSQGSLSSFGTGLLLHDFGKIEIPLDLLNKPSRLTSDEKKIIERHPEAGINLFIKEDKILKEALVIVAQHHENYDGTGYPHGIGGDEIQLFGRVLTCPPVVSTTFKVRVQDNTDSFHYVTTVCIILNFHVITQLCNSIMWCVIRLPDTLVLTKIQKKCFYTSQF